MKTTLTTAALALAAILAALSLGACAQLAGTTISFDADGNLTLATPPRAITIHPSK